MNSKETWNFIVKQYREYFIKPEATIQALWESYCSEFLGYSKLFDEYCSQLQIRVGTVVKAIPDIVLKKDGNLIFDIELKKYNLDFSQDMEAQIKSYLALLHLSVGMIVCKDIYLCSYDYSKNDFKKVKIEFDKDNDDGIFLIELLKKENISDAEIKKFIDEVLNRPQKPQKNHRQQRLHPKETRH